MAEGKAEYRGVAGFIQFEPNDREAAGKQVRDITIRPVSVLGAKGLTDGKVRATVWPDFADVTLLKGDAVFVEGRYTKNTVDGDNGPVTYHNISVTSLARLEGVSSSKPDVVNAQDDSGAEDEPF